MEQEKYKNYVEIYIKAELKKINNLGKKKIYKSRKKDKIVGINIPPEFPKKPDIIINNNFSKNTNLLSKELFKKIKKKYL